MFGGSKKWKKAFNLKLNSVCQKKVEDLKRSRGTQKCSKYLLKFAKHSGIWETKRYDKLQEIIESKNADGLHNKEFCFHPQPCRDEFQQIQPNQLR